MHIRYTLIIYILYYVCTLFSIFFRQLQKNAYYIYRNSPETVHHLYVRVCISIYITICVIVLTTITVHHLYVRVSLVYT